jgi:hypothetical protein
MRIREVGVLRSLVQLPLVANTPKADSFFSL